MLPSIDSLRCFSEVARLLSFRGAAKVVALTPAAVSQRIRQLEDEVGRPLFIRTTRRVELTEAGLSLVPRAREALEAAQRCLSAGRGELGPAPLELTIGTRHELGMSWILPVRQRLAVVAPHLTLHLYFGSGQDLERRLLDTGVMQIVAVTDPLQLGLHRQAMILIKVDGDVREVAEHLAAFDEVDYLVLTAGSVDLLAEVLVHDDDALLELLNDRIRKVPGVVGTESVIYLRLTKQTYAWNIP